MKKKLLIALGSFTLLIMAAITAVVIYFMPFLSSFDYSIVSFSNIKALYNGLTQDLETTNEKIKEIDDQRSEEIKNYVNVEVRDFTEEELRQIESGEKTKTEIVAGIIFESVNSASGAGYEEATEPVVTNPDASVTDNPVTENPVTENPVKDNPVTEKPQVSADAIVAKYIARLYECSNAFEGRVAALQQNAHNWIHAYKKANPGKTWREAKVEGVKHFTSTASQIEADCYAQVDALIEQLRGELRAINADTAIADTIKESAYNEMDARKAKIVQEGTAKLNKD